VKLGAAYPDMDVDRLRVRAIQAVDHASYEFVVDFVCHRYDLARLATSRSAIVRAIAEIRLAA